MTIDEQPLHELNTTSPETTTLDVELDEMAREDPGLFSAYIDTVEIEDPYSPEADVQYARNAVSEVHQTPSVPQVGSKADSVAIHKPQLLEEQSGQTQKTLTDEETLELTKSIAAFFRTRNIKDKLRELNRTIKHGRSVEYIPYGTPSSFLSMAINDLEAYSDAHPRSRKAKKLLQSVQEATKSVSEDAKVPTAPIAQTANTITSPSADPVPRDWEAEATAAEAKLHDIIDNPVDSEDALSPQEKAWLESARGAHVPLVDPTTKAVSAEESSKQALQSRMAKVTQEALDNMAITANVNEAIDLSDGRKLSIIGSINHDVQEADRVFFTLQMTGADGSTQRRTLSAEELRTLMTEESVAPTGQVRADNKSRQTAPSIPPYRPAKTIVVHSKPTAANKAVAELEQHRNVRVLSTAKTLGNKLKVAASTLGNIPDALSGTKRDERIHQKVKEAKAARALTGVTEKAGATVVANTTIKPKLVGSVADISPIGRTEAEKKILELLNNRAA